MIITNVDWEKLREDIKSRLDYMEEKSYETFGSDGLRLEGEINALNFILEDMKSLEM